MEEWRSIPSFTDFEASSLGNVRRVLGGQASKRGKPKRRHVNNKGYWAVGMGKNLKIQVHQLVAAAFFGPARGRHVNHDNGNKLDCRVSNLEYTTKRGNELHAEKMGLTAWGEKNGRSKLTDMQISEIKRRAREGEPCRALGLEFDVSESHVRNLRNGNRAKRVS